MTVQELYVSHHALNWHAVVLRQPWNHAMRCCLEVNALAGVSIYLIKDHPDPASLVFTKQSTLPFILAKGLLHIICCTPQGRLEHGGMIRNTRASW